MGVFQHGASDSAKVPGASTVFLGPPTLAAATRDRMASVDLRAVFLERNLIPVAALLFEVRHWFRCPQAVGQSGGFDFVDARPSTTPQDASFICLSVCLNLFDGTPRH